MSFTALADAGWAAPERERVFGWEARFASGVTKRANSAWDPSGDGSATVSGEALDAVETAYRARGLTPTFQLTSAEGAAQRLLIGRGYRVVDETLVLAASVSASPSTSASDRDVVIAEEPAGDWLAVWWAVDGRGDADDLAVIRQIMMGTPALYASLRVSGAVVAVARLALVGSWGGLYCVATLPEFRRRGFGARVVGALLAAGARRGVTDAWLQVLAGNGAAITLYSERFGFAAAERYRYLVGAA